MIKVFLKYLIINFDDNLNMQEKLSNHYIFLDL